MTDKNNKSEDNEDNEDNMVSIPPLLAFGYTLPFQIFIGLIVFINTEYNEVMHNINSDNYKAVRSAWFWCSRLVFNAIMAVTYWAEFHLVSEFSSIYMMVFGTIRNVSTLTLSSFVFNYKLSMFGWIGYAIAIAATSTFQYAKSFDNYTKH